MKRFNRPAGSTVAPALFAATLLSLLLILSLMAILSGCPTAVLTEQLETEYAEMGGGGGTPATYTVTYNANGAESGSVPTDTGAYEDGAGVTVRGNTGTLARTGYTFVGWNTAGDGTGIVTGTSYAPGSTFTISGASVTLYAEWQIPTYAVLYNANGADSGTVPADDDVYVEGEAVTIRGNTGTLVRSGFVFCGWTILPNDVGTLYRADDVHTMGSTDLILYACWVTPVTVTYDGNGNSEGDVPVDATLYADGDTVTTASNSGALSKGGEFAFAYWNFESDGSGEVYVPGDAFAIGDSDTTVYAIYIGDSGPAGGTLVYDKGNNDNGWRFLEAANADNGSTLFWSDVDLSPALNTREEIGYGVSNTAAIIAQAGHTASAAKICDVYEPASGFGDWFLPSRAELYRMWEILWRDLNDSSFAGGGFYLSSSESDYKRAWTKYFSGTYSDPYEIDGFKSTAYNVRAIRAFRSEEPLHPYVVYLDNGADSGTPPVHLYEAGETVVIAGNTGSLINVGYTFGGWNTKSDGSGISYAPGAPIAGPSGTLVLYAVWTGTYSSLDDGPASGTTYIFYDKGTYSDGWRYLEVAPSDQSPGYNWGQEIEINGDDATAPPELTDFGTGEINTWVIVDAMMSGQVAAKLCDDLDLGGYTDWFLPSKFELNLMNTVLNHHSPPIGDFASDYYWSSSEYSSNGAWAQDFGNGVQSHPDKGANNLRVRAVRAF